MKENKLVKLIKLFLTFAKIGLFTFGGGMSMIALFNAELCKKKHWIEDDEMVDIIAISEATPGSLAVNCATFIGYKQMGIIGGIIATLGATFPSLVIISIIAFFYDDISNIEVLNKAFNGIMGAVIVLIGFSCFNMAKAIKKHGNLLISCVLIFVTVLLRLLLPEISTFIIIIVGALIGVIIYCFILTNKEDTL